MKLFKMEIILKKKGIIKMTTYIVYIFILSFIGIIVMMFFNIKRFLYKY